MYYSLLSLEEIYLSFDIDKNGYHIETMNETDSEYLIITNTFLDEMCLIKFTLSLLWFILYKNKCS